MAVILKLVECCGKADIKDAFILGSFGIPFAVSDGNTGCLYAKIRVAWWIFSTEMAFLYGWRNPQNSSCHAVHGKHEDGISVPAGGFKWKMKDRNPDSSVRKR